MKYYFLILNEISYKDRRNKNNNIVTKSFCICQLSANINQRERFLECFFLPYINELKIKPH